MMQFDRMRAHLLVVAWLASSSLPACTQRPGDPPPPAPKYGLMIAPPGALGAHAAAKQTPGAALPEAEEDDEVDPENPEEPETPTPGVAPEEGVPL